jgi:hypothetical protein
MKQKYISYESYKEQKDNPKYNREKLWLIKGVIPMGEVVMIYGDKDVGKTFITLDIALQIITGSQELGHTKHGVVTYIPLEGKNGFFQRVEAAIHHKYPQEDGANLKINFWESDWLFDGGQDLSLPHKDISDDEWMSAEFEEIMDLRKPIPYRDWKRYGQWLSIDSYFCHVLIIDIFSKAIPTADINSWQDMNNVINNLETVIKSAREKRLKTMKALENEDIYDKDFDEHLTIILVHHCGKDSRAGALGSSILEANIPTILEVKKGKGKTRSLYLKKAKSFLEGKSFPLTLRDSCINGHETHWVDWGKEVNPVEDAILNRTANASILKKDLAVELRDQFKDQYASDKSFTTVFNRACKRLVETSFFDPVSYDEGILAKRNMETNE